jgi:hypothetical protein
MRTVPLLDPVEPTVYIIGSSLVCHNVTDHAAESNQLDRHC